MIILPMPVAQIYNSNQPDHQCHDKFLFIKYPKFVSLPGIPLSRHSLIIGIQIVRNLSLHETIWLLMSNIIANYLFGNGNREWVR